MHNFAWFCSPNKRYSGKVKIVTPLQHRSAGILIAILKDNINNM